MVKLKCPSGSVLCDPYLFECSASALCSPSLSSFLVARASVATPTPFHACPPLLQDLCGVSNLQMNLLTGVTFLLLPVYFVSASVGIVVSLVFSPFLAMSYLAIAIARGYRWFLINKALAGVDAVFLRLQSKLGTRESLRRKDWRGAEERKPKSRTSSFTSSQGRRTPPIHRVHSGTSISNPRRSPKSSLGSFGALSSLPTTEGLLPQLGMRTAHSRSPTVSPGPEYLPLKGSGSRGDFADTRTRRRTGSGVSLHGPRPVYPRESELDMDADDETSDDNFRSRFADSDGEELFMKPSPSRPTAFQSRQSFQSTSPVDPMHNYLDGQTVDMSPQMEMSLFRTSSGFDLQHSSFALGRSSLSPH
jgi:hypothetical protein